MDICLGIVRENVTTGPGNNRARPITTAIRGSPSPSAAHSQGGSFAAQTKTRKGDDTHFIHGDWPFLHSFAVEADPIAKRHRNGPDPRLRADFLGPITAENGGARDGHRAGSYGSGTGTGDGNGMSMSVMGSEREPMKDAGSVLGMKCGSWERVCCGVYGWYERGGEGVREGRRSRREGEGG